MSRFWFIAAVCIIGTFQCLADFSWVTWMQGDSSTAVNIAADHHGNSYVIGNFSGTVSFGSNTLTSVGGSDIFIAKIGRKGDVRWVISAGGTNDDSASTIHVTPHGSIFITGLFGDHASFGASNGLSGAFLGGISTRGEFTWVRSFTNIWTHTAVLDEQRRLWLVGLHGGFQLFSSWNRKGQNVSNIVSDTPGWVAWSFTRDRTGAFYVATSGGGRTIATLKFDPDGHTRWTNLFSLPGPRGLAGITVDRYGNVGVYGTTDNGFSPGRPGWTTIHNGYPSVAYFVTSISSAGELGAVSIYGQYKAVYQLGVVAIDAHDRTFTAGNFVSSWAGGTPWYRGAFINGFGFSLVITNTARWRIGDPWTDGTVAPRAIAVNQMGYIFVTGDFSGSAYFGTNRVGISSSGPSQAFVTRIDDAAHYHR